MNVFELTDASKPFLLVGAAITLAIVLGLRRWSPGKRWLALLLAILFGPAGHLYLKGGARYILLLYAAWFGLLVATPLPPVVGGLLLTVLSALLMNVRIQNAAKPKSA
jgi:H+/Cl- antiporter ClcA